MDYPMDYNEPTLRGFDAAVHAGELTGPGVGRGAAGSVAEGTWVQFDIQLGAGTGKPRIETARIETARFRAYGCPHTIAIADWVCERAAGRAPGAGLPESIESLQRRFAVPVPKMGRLLLIEDAWAAALAALENA
jgi:hypothetical protein